MKALKGRRGTLNRGKRELMYGLTVEILKLKPKDEKEIVVMQGVGVILQRATCLRPHTQDCEEWGLEACILPVPAKGSILTGEGESFLSPSHPGP